MKILRCSWLKIEPDQDGIIRLRRRESYRCGYPDVRLNIPISITANSGWTWPPSRTWVTPEMCMNCVCHWPVESSQEKPREGLTENRP